ncbi:MAG: YraN family protein [Candidatus Cloacimonetes bacterium]|jgi:putative endonuclease|nr:YraN family protein [Candidatus Cloacimonadota bacterium]MDY0337055.1 YraN family protein [Candidatus Cloacimonadaceae bacterium]MDD2544216.1 YraN family protein [Candidatus Cloacimonadota bacterium]MDD2683237.1 YraN family protein [Candidatus Cloacimonadota bacterium]MDD3096236.1 YraN family protein [Candidatus Cloacimonadota bacterium]
MSDSKNRELASMGENLAAKYLERQGYRLVCRNYRCRQGEIDLIVEKDQQLIFVEVKTRSYHSISAAVENISFKKKQRISRTAYLYLKQNPQYGKYNTRFDAIIILRDKGQDSFRIHHFEDAFEPILEDCY